uniref:C-type lectin domain-containing protein n=1 Tax=Poecilia latipinna TaxID=48699 RepID=A0A3B3VRW6_9TELE
MTLNEDIKYLLGEKDKSVTISRLPLNLLIIWCELCPLEWILYKGKCYLFYDKPPRWKTWEESQRFCQIRRSHLVVIDDLQEQVKSNAKLEI